MDRPARLSLTSHALRRSPNRPCSKWSRGPLLAGLRLALGKVAHDYLA
jgi:acetoacetate decarboxylase